MTRKRRGATPWGEPAPARGPARAWWLVGAVVVLGGAVAYPWLHREHRKSGGSPPVPNVAAPATAASAAPGAASPANPAAAAPARNLASAGNAPRSSGPQSAFLGSSAAALGASTVDVMVKTNDTLDGIFRRLKLNLADLASLRSLPGLKARLDSLRPGERLHFVHRDGSLFALERRLSETETLKVVREDDNLKADVLKNPLQTKVRTLRASIDSSLFEAVESAGGHDQTAVALADIFGWDIDFVLDIQRGDSFVVTYEELYRDGAYLHDGTVLAASFTNNGREFDAVRYVDPQGNAHYYTPDGRSMHKAFLRAPVEFTRVSSKFNTARHHPILNLIRAHKGTDYAAPIGTPVKAAGDGKIRFAGGKGGYGNVVEIDHSRGIVTVYGHLSRFAKGTHVGAHVSQGDIIAYVGMTGLATGPHLHYEYRVNGVFKNPQTVALADAEPIDPRLREDFAARTAPLLGSLVAPMGPALVSR
ncbi:MAG TPA: peptidoglycan DD-metalloendopeptidase family protein [Steroidobacteraceae bacterium]